MRTTFKHTADVFGICESYVSVFIVLLSIEPVCTLCLVRLAFFVMSQNQN